MKINISRFDFRLFKHFKISVLQRKYFLHKFKFETKASKVFFEKTILFINSLQLQQHLI